MIKSKNNPKIKLIRSLYRKKDRYKNKKYLVEGLQLSLDYIKYSNNIDFCIISEEFNNKKLFCKENLELKIYEVGKELFNQISDTQNSQGIILVVNFEEYNIEDILKHKFIVLLDSIQDPGNLGTIIRTCDGFDVGGIITLENTVDLYNSKTVRASMGSIVKIPIINYNDNRTIINILKKNGFRILASTPRYNKDISNINKNDKKALIIGNEGRGVSPYLIDISDELVGIRMKKEVESLNAAVAAGILIYEITK